MIWIEESQYCLRIIDGDPAQRPPYRAVGTIIRHGDVAMLKGFLGQFTRSDLVEFIKKISEMGVRHILLERAGNHRLPFGKKINAPEGPFDGWWHIDLGQAIHSIATTEQNRSGRIPENSIHGGIKNG